MVLLFLMFVGSILVIVFSAMKSTDVYKDALVRAKANSAVVEQTPETPGVRAGYVEMYFHTSRRLFVLKFPGHEDRIFNLRLPANPMKTKYRNWSEWQNPDFVAKADQQPTRFSGGNDYQIRYKVDYQDR